MIVNVSDFGAASDGKVLASAAIQKAIDFCYQNGGGKVVFESGTYLIGSLYMRSNVFLELPRGCVLFATSDLTAYNAPDAWSQNVACVNPFEHTSGGHLIIFLEVENCGIVGEGRIDGNGEYLSGKKTHSYKDPEFLRPAQMIYMCESNCITLRNIELYNSPYWNCYIHGCDNVILTGLRLKNCAEIYNGDGIDVDSSSRILISDCIIETQDDCLTFRCVRMCLKNPHKITSNITVSNCILSTRSCNAIRIGCGRGEIRDMNFSNIVATNCGKVICMESQYARVRDRPGVRLENISFSNIVFDNCDYFLFLSSSCWNFSDPVMQSPPIRNITFSHIRGNMLNNIVVQAHEGIEISNILFHDAALEITREAKLLESYGYTEWDFASSKGVFYIANARDVTFDHVRCRITNGAAPFEYSVLGHNAENLNFRDILVTKKGATLPERLVSAAMNECKMESHRDFMKGDTFMAYPVTEEDLSFLE